MEKFKKMFQTTNQYHVVSQNILDITGLSSGVLPTDRSEETCGMVPGTFSLLVQPG